jgi:hypothetical protein
VFHYGPSSVGGSNNHLKKKWSDYFLLLIQAIPAYPTISGPQTKHLQNTMEFRSVIWAEQKRII